jgi:hypothetical protein
MNQCFGFGSGLDQYSVRSVHPDTNPDSESRSGFGSKTAKKTRKNGEKFKKFHVLKCWMFSFEGQMLLLWL